MKKLILFILVLSLNCGHQQYASYYSEGNVYNHLLLKTITIKNPSFLIYTENDYASKYYYNQLENIFIENKIPIYFKPDETITSQNSGIAVGKGGLAFYGGSGKATINKNVTNTGADCILLVNCSSWEFKVLSGNSELLMKGFIENSLEDEIPVIIQELIGKQSDQPEQSDQTEQGKEMHTKSLFPGM